MSKTQPGYIAVLKGKEGEYAALEELSVDARATLMPLIEVPDVPYDYANDTRAKSLDDHVSGVAERLRRCWPNRPLYLDMPWFEENEQLEDGRVAFEGVLNDCLRLGVNAIPVVSRSNSEAYLVAAGRYARTTRQGGCIRLLIPDFDEAVDVESDIRRLLDGLGADDASSVDLVIDLENLAMDTARAVLVTRSIFSMMPRRDEWRRIVLAAASFPEDLSDIDAATITTLPRREWDLWTTLHKRPERLPRPDIIYADYAVAHPYTKELDPRTMRMSASIRYTTPNSWIVTKGRNVRQYGFDQYFELAKDLAQHPEFQGRDFSWGDKYIADCAVGMIGPGNATTWRKVGTNHHLTLVARQVASLSLAA
jgi:Beta protein